MPGWEQTSSLYHSFNIGRAHVVGINTEDIEHGSAASCAAREQPPTVARGGFT